MTVPAAIVRIGAAAAECQVLSATISHGRDDPTTQPVASAATVEVVGALPPEAVIGAQVVIVAQVGASQITRFTGEISDLEIGFDSVDVARPRIVAVGALARLGRRVVGDSPWPAELDGERVNRILTLGGYPPEPTRTDPGTLEVLARDVDRQPALALAHDSATDGGGIVWQDRDGRILYADALHRRGAASVFEFRACDIGIGIGWAQTLEGLANDVVLRYGPEPAGGGEQPYVLASNPPSIAERGTYGASMTTAIATAPDAQKRADEIVARQAAPAWVLGGLEANLALYDFAHTYSLLALVEVHSLVNVTGLPAGSPATNAMLWVEGWRESIEATPEGPIAWVINFATSDYCRTSAPPRWDDMPDTATWDSLDPARTWDAAVCIPPEPSRGRWDDVAASLRWDQVNDSYAWDTWPL